MTYARDERLALAALLAETGPDAPTLCAGWQTKDLAAHMVVRERRPDAGLGMVGGPLAVEYFVHHEDVRRGADGWTERELSPGLSDALWKRLKSARLFLRGAPTGVALARADASAPEIIARRAPGVVTVAGTPAELTLWSMGRSSAANVTLEGPDEAVAQLRAWRQ